ncbi:hypothetical protein [Nesterenkonia muleiensis]|uniref:hypothetical protein n=1 Tax=Nesterenkonia muleiensis TaxID=2282648 RepID=UPI000E76F977|nr:hypothetical protein [Nesterenkonia muleiensis]
MKKLTEQHETPQNRENKEIFANPALENKSVFVRRVGEVAIYKMYDKDGANPVEVAFPTKPMFSDVELIKAGFMKNPA